MLFLHNEQPTTSPFWRSCRSESTEILEIGPTLAAGMQLTAVIHCRWAGVAEIGRAAAAIDPAAVAVRVVVAAPALRPEAAAALRGAAAVSAAFAARIASIPDPAGFP